VSHAVHCGAAPARSEPGLQRPKLAKVTNPFDALSSICGAAPARSEADGADEQKAKAALAKIQADKEAKAAAERDNQRALVSDIRDFVPNLCLQEEQKRKREADMEAAKAGKLDSPVSPGFTISVVDYRLDFLSCSAKIMHL